MKNADIVLASHGNLAEGYIDTLKMLGVDTSCITVLSFYGSSGANVEDIHKLIENCNESRPLVVFTDIMFGSVNQMFLTEKEKSGKKNIYIITGMNLPAVMAVCMESEQITGAKIASIVAKAKEQLVFETDRVLKSFSCDDDVLS